MLKGKIAEGTPIVVFDMEWNQPIGGKTYYFDVTELTGEVIEIGAVKYIYSGGTLTLKDVFSCDIAPKMYKTMHYHVKKVTHKTTNDLRNGRDFSEAYSDFKKFCGDDAILAGWGNSDTDMLKMNLKFFGLEDKLGLYFVDVQPIFSAFAGERGKQRSVEFAVDYYGIPKAETFHSATADAKYTGEILKCIFDCNKTSEVLSAVSSSAIDPDIKRDFSMVSAPCENVNNAFAMLDGFGQKCPLCGGDMTPEISRFRIRKSAYALYSCKEHGDMYLRIRIKKNREGLYYGAAVLRLATQNDYYLVASKREEYTRFGEDGAPEVTSDSKENEPEDKNI